MRVFTSKQMALRSQPKLKSKKTGNTFDIILDDSVIASATTASKAWLNAYHEIAKDEFKVGDLIVMRDCMEAKSNTNKVWICSHASFKTQHGDYGVFLENFSGYFLSAFLRKATPEEELNYYQQIQSDEVK